MEQSTVNTSAFRLQQSRDKHLYLFSLEVSVLRRLTSVHMLGRDEEGNIEGYQRSGSDQYINDVASYLRQENALLPNSIILSLSPNSKFERSDVDGEEIGHLQIPMEDGGETRIVDGQQRMRALSKTASGNYPVPVTAFITDDVSVEREQFFRVNRSKSLPSGLVNELLPVLNDPLPERLQDRKIPSIICEKLNRRESSPLQGMIRRKSTTGSSRSQAVIKDSSLMGVIQESLSSPSGCLFFYHNVATGDVDIDGVMTVLTTFWGAVREVFPDAWGLPAKRSRLMHSAGIQVMGNMMDLIMRSINPSADDAEKQVRCELERFAPVCRWTSGSWKGLNDLKWNDLKGTNRHVEALTKHLTDVYFDDLHRS